MLLESLSLLQDSPLATEHLQDVLTLARSYSLSAYDAAYLELSVRRNAPLATLDQKLQQAARLAGVVIFEE